MIRILVLTTFIFLFSCNDKTTNLDYVPFNPADWKNVSGSWSYTDSILKQDSVGQPNSGLGYQIYTGDITWKNYIVSFDVKSETIDWVGLLFRYTDEYNAYFFLLRNGSCQLGINTGTSRKYTVLKTYSSTLKKDTWYSVRANISEDTFKLYVDDTLYFNEKNDLLKSGSIALGSVGASYFRNIKVKHL